VEDSGEGFVVDAGCGLLRGAALLCSQGVGDFFDLNQVGFTGHVVWSAGNDRQHVVRLGSQDLGCGLHAKVHQMCRTSDRLTQDRPNAPNQRQPATDLL